MALRSLRGVFGATPAGRLCRNIRVRCYSRVSAKNRLQLNRITKPPGTVHPLSPNDLVRWFEDACNAGPQLIGTEHEKFAVARDADGAIVPVNYEEHVRPMLRSLVEEHGWEVGDDRGIHGEVVALRRDNASVTLEPGGQLELSGAPLGTIAETCEEFRAHQFELDAVARTHGVTLLAAGFHPFARRDEIRWMPKGRYAVMRDYLPTRGARALDMMTRTATVQANFDYRSEVDCGRRLRVSAALTPALVSMFANSPYEEGKFQDTTSRRSSVWEDVDPDRCGLVDVLFDGDFSFDRYALWALEIPMFFVKRQGDYIPHHAPFSAYIEDGLRLPDGTTTHATEADWQLHLNTLFPEARLNPFIELRSPDSVPHELICALPAFAKGLLYDDDACAETWDLLGGPSLDQRREAWSRARTAGLRDDALHRECAALLDISARGLKRIAAAEGRAHDEGSFLDPLRRSVDARRSPAHDALEALGEQPGNSAAGRAALCQHYYYAGASIEDA